MLERPAAMRTFIYKRTHKGDPDKNGCFGIWDCMGKDRGFHFDAVIGVGGIGAEPKAVGIDRKVNWIGIGSQKKRDSQKRGPLVTFEQFVLFEEKGVDLRAVAPRLAALVLHARPPICVQRQFQCIRASRGRPTFENR
jgi:hypothetical protein